MTRLRCYALAALLLLSAVGNAIAQIPPPIPSLPDSERRTSYSITANTCACAVNFALYEDSNDVDQQIQVWINGVQFLSTDPSHGWGLTSATGPLASIPRPITDAVLTFTAVQTGTVQIVGAQRPRRLSQFAENRGVAARDLNQVLTYLTSTQRERWDLNSRTLRGLPGETITPLPSQATRALSALGFDSSGNPIALSPSLGLGTVVGPVSSVDGHVAVFSGTTGQIIRDGGPGVGTVSSVGLALPNIFSISGSPVTGSGTLTGTLSNQTANFVFAGPTSGSAAAPNFRGMVAQDIATASSNILPVYLVIGDSNGTGQGSSASSPTVPAGQVLEYCASGAVQDANDPVCSAVTAAQNANTGSMWPAAGIAYGRKVGFVVTAVSGSTQASAADFGVGNGNWQATSAGSNNANALAAINAALTAYKAAGYAPVFQGIIYVLGSNDAAQIDSSVITVGQYSSALSAFATFWRAATIGGTTYPHMQIWMPIIGTSTLVSDVGYSQVRAAQLAFAAADGNTAVPFVDMFSFNARGLMNSGAHPTQAGYNIMGTAIGSALIPAIPAKVPYRQFNANAGIGGAAPNGTVLQVIGVDAAQSIVSVDAYGAAAATELRHAAGTLVAPTATQNGDGIAIYGAQSFGATTFGSTNQGALLFSATQNQTDTAKGTQACIYTTANGSATPTCNLTVDQAGNIQINSAATFNWNADAFLSRSAAAVIHLGQVDAASPVAQTLGVQGVVAGTSNTAGADWTIAGSKGTGTGTGGNIKFQVAPAGSTGSTVNALADVLQIYNTQRVNISATNSAPDSLLTINANTGVTSPLAQTGTVLHLVGADSANSILTFDSFGTGLGIFQGRLQGGTRASPTAAPAASYTFNISGQGYDGVSAFGGLADIGIKTLNQTSTTDHSGQIILRTVASGSTGAPTQRMLLLQGVIVGTGTTDPGAGNLAAAGYLLTGTTVVGSLPTCNAGTKGARYFVTDANASTFHTTAAGGGANNVGVTCDGTNWYISANDNIPAALRRKFA